MWTTGRRADRKARAKPAIRGRTADVPGTSSEPPSSTSRWTSMVTRAQRPNSGLVYSSRATAEAYG